MTHAIEFGCIRTQGGLDIAEIRTKLMAHRPLCGKWSSYNITVQQPDSSMKKAFKNRSLKAFVRCNGAKGFERWITARMDA